MTANELTAVMEAVGVVMREQVVMATASVSEIATRVKALEERASVPGPIGPQGEKGLSGDAGGRGEQGPEGKSVTPEQINNAVAQYIAAHPIQEGKDGRDGKSFTAGVGPPSVDGQLGEVYLDAKTGDVYQCR